MRQNDDITGVDKATAMFLWDRGTRNCASINFRDGIIMYFMDIHVMRIRMLLTSVNCGGYYDVLHTTLGQGAIFDDFLAACGPACLILLLANQDISVKMYHMAFFNTWMRSGQDNVTGFFDQVDKRTSMYSV
jgi:hypothetical protein